MRYRLDLQYDGTDFHGWQIQPNAHSVEAEIEKALSTILRETIDCVGCGRTDTGVHASFFTAHFDSIQPIDCEQLAYKLRHLVPETIGILGVTLVEDDFHARFSALSRSYIYRLQYQNNPFNRHFCHLVRPDLDIQLMNESCQDLIGEHEFSAFCKGAPSSDHYRCTVLQAHWISDNDGAEFHISANRFLRNMVRAIVGTQLEIGRGKLTLEKHRELILGGTRSEAGMSVPARGLTLCEVVY